MNPSKWGFLAGCVLCTGAIVYWLSPSPLLTVITIDSQQQGPASHSEAILDPLAHLPAISDDTDVISNEKAARAIDQRASDSLDSSLAVVAVPLEPASKLAVAENSLDSAGESTAAAGSIPATGSAIDYRLNLPGSAGADTDLIVTPAAQVEAELQLFWGPFNAEIRAKSFASHLTKLVQSPMLVVESIDGFYIAFEYFSQQQRAEILKSISQNGLSLKLVE